MLIGLEITFVPISVANPSLLTTPSRKFEQFAAKKTGAKYSLFGKSLDKNSHYHNNFLFLVLCMFVYTVLESIWSATYNHSRLYAA